jgi:uncharacterized BrkB/YihY/UPF0761 family membrane protein
MNIVAYLLGFFLTSLASYVLIIFGADYTKLNPASYGSSDVFISSLSILILVLNLGVWFYLYKYSKRSKDKKIKYLAYGVLTATIAYGFYAAYTLFITIIAAKFGCCW